MSEHAKREEPHIVLSGTGESKLYTYSGGGGGGDTHHFPQRDRAAHGEALKNQFGEVGKEFEKVRQRRSKFGIPETEGELIQFDLVPNKDLNVLSLERRGSGINLFNYKPIDEEHGTATVFVPRGKLAIIERKLERYLDPAKDSPKSGLPRGAKLWNSVSSLRRATFESLWTDPLESIPTDGDEQIWWEVWVARERGYDAFREQADALDLTIGSEPLEFPTCYVVTVQASPDDMVLSADLLDTIAELQRARSAAHELMELPSVDQKEFIEELHERLVPPTRERTRVCILDTGLDHDHPLLEVATDPDVCDTYEEEWGTRDSSWRAHGCQMAGFALYDERLKQHLLSNKIVELETRLESVKLLPSADHVSDSELDGEKTKTVVAKAEINDPFDRRVYAISATRAESPAGKPTSWSAAIDAVASGSEEGDRPRRLVMTAAGNADWMDPVYTYPDGSITSPVQDPGCAWNALTVGSFTKRGEILPVDEYPGWQAAAPIGGMSPSNSTGWTWKLGAPNKPDLVMEGGNAAKRPDADNLDFVDSLLTSTTGKWEPGHRPITVSGETSGAVALAANLAARLWNRNPKLWPETVRALLAHSARWTPAMEDCVPDGYSRRRRARFLLRCFGHGVPNLERAAYSAANQTTIIIEDELQPFELTEDSGDRTKDMRVHELVWPGTALESIADVPVRLRVTLSYFIEPNPGEKGWNHRYSYGSFGLRFDTKTATETTEQFLKRISKAQRAENERASSSSDVDAWEYGEEARRGSLHQDIWHGTAQDLAGKGGIIAVYPVMGWWRYLKSAGRQNRRARYSLVVSLETEEEDVEVDFYNEILYAIDARPEVHLIL